MLDQNCLSIFFTGITVDVWNNFYLFRHGICHGRKDIISVKFSISWVKFSYEHTLFVVNSPTIVFCDVLVICLGEFDVMGCKTGSLVCRLNPIRQNRSKNLR